MHQRKVNTDVVVAILIAALGAGAAIMSLSYRTGSLTRMGPGFFPLMIAVLVVVLAVANVFASLGRPTDTSQTRLAPVLWVAAALIAWTVLIRPTGMIAANAALVSLAAMGRPPVRPVSTGLLVIGLTVAGWLIFIAGLGLPLTLTGR